MLGNYFKIAIRVLLKNRMYSLINIGGLALSIFGSIIIFQLVKYHVSTDTHHHRAGDIYRVVMDLHLDDAVEHEKGSPFVLHKTIKNDFAGIESAAYIGQHEMTVAVPDKSGGADKYLEKEAAAFIGEEYFKVFDYQWKRGAASVLNNPNTVVLTESYSKKYFGDTDPLGKTIILNNAQVITVAGIVKDVRETTDLATSVFISLPTMKTVMPDFGYSDWSWFAATKETFIRLKPNENKERIETQLPAFAKKYYGEMAKYYHFHLQPLADIHFNTDYDGTISRSSMGVFSLIGILLILIACINFINLSTAQSFKRFKETGIRKTLGSSRIQVFGQFMTEVAIVAVIAVVIALFLAYAATPVVNDWLDTNLNFSRFFDGEVLIFAFALIVFTILAAGFYPSLVLSGFNPLHALKGSFKVNKGVLLRKTLVVTQFSISFVLIAMSVLIVLQLDFLRNKEIGIDKNLVVHVKVPATSHEGTGMLKNQLLSLPDVQSVSFSSNPPSAQSGWGGSVKYDNRDWEKFVARSRIADEDYLDTYRIKLVSGRKPSPSDTVNEVLINQQLVKNLGLKEAAQVLNKRLVIGDAGDAMGTIVGVVADFNTTDLYSGIEPAVIFSSKDRYKQAAIRLRSFDSRRTIRNIETAWEKAYPNNVFEYSFYDKELAAFYQKEELTSNVVISFAGLSVFISCLGLFGLVSFTVSRRTKEIGVRKVLGAGSTTIAMLLSKEFLKLVLIAIMIAVPVAYYVMYRWLLDFAYRVPISWWIFVVSGFAGLLIAWATVGVQALRAALANPVKSLRTE